MGELWTAEHVGLGTEVVVKFIAEELANRPRVAERFAREAAAAAQINSAHVVKILDDGQSDGVPFLVMDSRDAISRRASRRTAFSRPIPSRASRGRWRRRS